MLGSKAVELLAEGRNDAVSVLQYHADEGFHEAGYDANWFRDRWGLIHPRQMHPALYDPVAMKPSQIGVNDLLPIFSDARYAEALTWHPPAPPTFSSSASIAMTNTSERRNAR